MILLLQLKFFRHIKILVGIIIICFLLYLNLFKTKPVIKSIAPANPSIEYMKRFGDRIPKQVIKQMLINRMLRNTCNCLRQVDRKLAQPIGCDHTLCQINNNKSPIIDYKIQEVDECYPIVKCVTVVIKTRNRFIQVSELIKSAWKMYPYLKFIIIDDIYDYKFHYSELGRMIRYTNLVTYKTLGINGGISAGRNLGFKLSLTKYTLVLDDDNIFNANTNLNKLVEVLETTNLDLVGGCISKCKLHGNFRIHQNKDSQEINLILYENVFYDFVAGHDDCVVLDVNENFFLARTDYINKIGGWSEELSVAEHMDFFLKLMNYRSKIGLCTNVHIDHKPIEDEVSIRFRSTWDAYFNSFLKNWGLSNFKRVSNEVQQQYKALYNKQPDFP